MRNEKILTTGSPLLPRYLREQCKNKKDLFGLRILEISKWRWPPVSLCTVGKMGITDAAVWWKTACWAFNGKESESDEGTRDFVYPSKPCSQWSVSPNRAYQPQTNHSMYQPMRDISWTNQTSIKLGILICKALQLANIKIVSYRGGMMAQWVVLALHPWRSEFRYLLPI